MSYKCDNCEARAKAEWVKAMLDAGFGLKHLACQSCGQHALRECNPSAVALGALGGSARSAAKSSASRANGAKGGRPKRKPKE